MKASLAARITIFQLLIWLIGGIGFLLTQVDRQGQYVFVPMAILYVVLCIAAMMLVAMKLGRMRFSRACMSPGMLLIELAVITGNATPWVIAEPAMLLAVGNISLFAGRLPTQQAPAAFFPEKKQVKAAHPQGSKLAVITVGGIGGGFDSPAKGLYSKLAVRLPSERIAVYDLAFRNPGELQSCVADVRGAVALALQEGNERVVLVGHSFGGGVVVRAGLAEPAVCSVILLSTQTTGCERVNELAPRPVLLVHGVFDYINPRYTTENVYRLSGEPKTMRLVFAGHLLDEAADEVFNEVCRWSRRFADDAGGPGGPPLQGFADH